MSFTTILSKLCTWERNAVGPKVKKYSDKVRDSWRQWRPVCLGLAVGLNPVGCHVPLMGLNPGRAFAGNGLLLVSIANECVKLCGKLCDNDRGACEREWCRSVTSVFQWKAALDTVWKKHVYEMHPRITVVDVKWKTIFRRNISTLRKIHDRAYSH